MPKKKISPDPEKPWKYNKNKKLIRQAYEAGLLDFSGDAGCEDGRYLWVTNTKLDKFIDFVKKSVKDTL